MKNKKLCITMAVTTLAVSVGGFLGYELKKANKKLRALNSKIDETNARIDNNDFENAQNNIDELKKQCSCKKCLNKKIAVLSNKLEDKKSTSLHNQCNEIDANKLDNENHNAVTHTALSQNINDISLDSNNSIDTNTDNNKTKEDINDTTTSINDTNMNADNKNIDDTNVEKVDDKAEAVSVVDTNNSPKEIVNTEINDKNKFNKKHNKHTKHNKNH